MAKSIDDMNEVELRAALRAAYAVDVFTGEEASRPKQTAR